MVYYIPPQVWAWRSGRAQTLARFTKGAVVLFPFEVEFLRESGVNAVFAGHPILDEIAPFLDAPPDPERFGIPPGKRGIGLLPGSRPGEVAAHLPILLAAARLLLQRFPDLHFALPVARPSLREAIAGESRRSGLPVTLVDDGAATPLPGAGSRDGGFGDRHARARPARRAGGHRLPDLLAELPGRPSPGEGRLRRPSQHRLGGEVPAGTDPGRLHAGRIAGALGRSWPIRRFGRACARRGSRCGSCSAGRAPRRRSSRCWGRRRREHGREPLPADARVHAAVRPEAPPRDAS